MKGVTIMEDQKKELNTDTLEEVSGGSFVHTEASIREAGIDLLLDDGKTPGEFGYLWNTGDYYFKGKKLKDDDIRALQKYQDHYGQIAPSLDAAWDYYNTIMLTKRKF